MAILRLPEGEKLPAVAPLADSSRLEPGMRVLAIGSPLGTDYQNTKRIGSSVRRLMDAIPRLCLGATGLGGASLRVHVSRFTR
ncbi:MAG: hypothetical protein ACH37Z_10405 [Anaerolineae bacterium]